MNPLLEQFLSEARDFLEEIAQKLLQLEDTPEDADLLGGLFRLVHTLKGNSGLFEFGALTRVVHAAEDLLDLVRSGALALDVELTDKLLEAMDFVGRLLDAVERTGGLDDRFDAEQAEIVEQLRAYLPEASSDRSGAGASQARIAPPGNWDWLAEVPEAARMELLAACGCSGSVLAVRYLPESECFFKGEDPLLTLKSMPGLAGLALNAIEDWSSADKLDVYNANLVFDALSTASLSELQAHFRYVPEQVVFYTLPALALALPAGDPNGGPIYGDFVEEAQRRLTAQDLPGLSAAVAALLEMVNSELWVASALRWVTTLLRLQAPSTCLQALLQAIDLGKGPDWYSLLQTQDQAAVQAAPANADVSAALAPLAAPAAATPPESAAGDLSVQDQALMRDLLATQRRLMDLPFRPEQWAGRLASVCNTLRNLYLLRDDAAALEQAIEVAQTTRSFAPLAKLLDQQLAPQPLIVEPDWVAAPAAEALEAADGNRGDAGRSDGVHAPAQMLKVSMEKVDRLMDLIGEMVVAKNALPYLADRAENVFGSRDLGREIKTQYAVINRIAEEMQYGIMQVRMLPMGSLFQRFPRLVRDVARQLGKQVRLVVEGDDTEADKNIVEALGDPLIHILRNSLDHGIELPELRQAQGKPVQGTLTVSARQEGDRAVITVQDDGKGIDPVVIKAKALERGLIDQARADALSDADVVQLVFAAGFSTAEAITSLSGRGVGMDVVRASIAKLGGTVHLSSNKGQGTRIELSLPLSVTVSNVMMVHLAGQRFGVPMDAVVETVRVHQDSIHHVKNQKAVVLRNQLIPLFGGDSLLRLEQAPHVNEHGEYAVLLVRVGADIMGLLVDGFDQTVDIILKPLEGPLAGLPGFAGTALLGDGSVLLVLDVKELN